MSTTRVQRIMTQPIRPNMFSVVPLLLLSAKPRFTEKGNDGARKDTNEENCGEKEVSGDNSAAEIRVRAFRVLRSPSGSRYLFSHRQAL
ncbi:hypothetical protein SUGI_0184850 [Cryptomeria japonica]|nr:hypothetical protein SUGI_0184580 [Cryptomeria japonica]GLJ12125.1 hypothetical protein SUGI_0184850 [Cryptomeria japonica]